MTKNSNKDLNEYKDYDSKPNLTRRSKSFSSKIGIGSDYTYGFKENESNRHCFVSQDIQYNHLNSNHSSNIK